MNKILIAGSSGGIGRSISEKLLADANQVVGLARDHAKFKPNNKNYYPIVIDFRDKKLEQQLKDILHVHNDVTTLILSAGVGYFGNLEQLSWAGIQEVMQVNFLSQVLLTKIFLPTLKKQHDAKIIIIGSEAALHGAKQGSIYCASKFALRGFTQSLRAECASSEVAVSLINPGLVQTSFFDRLHFKPGDAAANKLIPQQVADMVAAILPMTNNAVVEEINLRPMRHVVQKNVCH